MREGERLEERKRWGGVRMKGRKEGKKGSEFLILARLW